MPQPLHFYGRLNGYRAIVTGAGSVGDGVGTGKAIAAFFAAEGAKVALVDLDETRALSTLSLIQKLGGSASVFVGDVADGRDAERIVNAAADWLGGLDILVNNVGIGSAAGKLHLVDPTEIARVMAINFGSAVNMSRSAIAHLLNGKGKAIINIASIAGTRAHGTAAYGPSKAAMMQLTTELAFMYGREGIRANSVVPGHIFTPMVEAHVHGERRRIRRDIAPLGVEGDGWDVAQAALFLAGPESRFITGASLPVDGGVSQIAALAAYESIHS